MPVYPDLPHAFSQTATRQYAWGKFIVSSGYHFTIEAGHLAPSLNGGGELLTLIDATVVYFGGGINDRVPIVFSGFSSQAYLRLDHYAGHYVAGHLVEDPYAGVYQVIDPVHPENGGYFLYRSAGDPRPPIPADSDFTNYFSLPMTDFQAQPPVPAGSVDGSTAAAFPHGVIQGNGGAVDVISGSDGVNDRLMGEAACNQYHGGTGADAFVLSAKYATLAGAHIGSSSSLGDQFAYLGDFEGAGAGGGDFIALTGFKAGSLHLEHGGAVGPDHGTLYHYTVQDLAGHVFNLTVNSLDGKALGAGDFAFY